MFEDIIKYFPINIARELKENIKDFNLVEEIRIRQNKPIILKFNNSERIIHYYVTANEILEIMQHLCDNSIYSYQSQICNGYITIKGGHRVGITGSVV